jgi:hypothetical protein
LTGDRRVIEVTAAVAARMRAVSLSLRIQVLSPSQLGLPAQLHDES